MPPSATDILLFTMLHPLVLQQRRAANIARDIQSGLPDSSHEDPSAFEEGASVSAMDWLHPPPSESGQYRLFR